MKQFVTLAVFATVMSLFSYSADARKTYLVKSENNMVAQPRVRNFDCTYCWVKDDDN